MLRFLGVVAVIVSSMASAETPTAQASSAPTTLLGVELGGPLSIPECVTTHSSTGARFYAPHGLQHTMPCWEHLGGGPQPGTPFNPDVQKILIRVDKAPLGMDPLLIGTLLNEKLEDVRINTLGVTSQRFVADALIEKYGPPTSDDSHAVQNRMGANFDKLQMTWKFANLLVFFEGMTDKIDRGWVLVRTPAGQSYKDAELARLKAEQPKL